MSLRRVAQTNNASYSPRSSLNNPFETSTPYNARTVNFSHGSGSAGSSSLPTTPRTNRPFAHQVTPKNSESRSASIPFDWEAARLRKPPPYASPLQNARARAARKSLAGQNSNQRRIVRKKTLRERLEAIPARIMFEISLFPNNLPFPEPKTVALILGGFMHLSHACIKLSQLYTNEYDEPWYDDTWFSWGSVFSWSLTLASLYSCFSLFSAVKFYEIFNREDLVASPHAAFVSAQLDFSPIESPPVFSRILSLIGQLVLRSWRFFLDSRPPVNRYGDDSNLARFQRLTVWSPGELELHLLSLYSPVHSLLWMMMNGSNWILVAMTMIAVGFQTHLLIDKYDGLIRDKAIIAAEVMREYDTKFVNPRINPIRKDAQVMTHESEVVTPWN